MIRSLLIGIVSGMRSLTPIAIVSHAASTRQLPRRNGAPEFLSHRGVSQVASALAVGELIGDKWHRAPDRIVAAGMAARVATAALSGAALAPRKQQTAAALIAAAAALVAAHLTFNLRMRAMQRHGQFVTGAIEDAITIGSALLVVYGMRHGRRRR